LASMICDRILVLYAGTVVESRVTRGMFTHPLHPYTAGLLRARPSLDNRRERLEVIPGRPPLPSETVSGCPFAPRCEFVQELCRSTPVALRDMGDGGKSACLRSDEIAGLLANGGAG